MTTAHVAPLAAWMAEHHPEIPFDRTRWAGCLSWTADQIAAALETIDTTTVPTSAELNDRIRRLDDYERARAHIVELRRELHHAKPELAEKRAARDAARARDDAIDARRHESGRAS